MSRHIITGCAGFVGSHLAKRLIESGRVDLNLKSKNGSTPLMLAIKKQGTQIAKMLIENGGKGSNIPSKLAGEIFEFLANKDD